jgi:hypothetical protein
MMASVLVGAIDLFYLVAGTLTSTIGILPTVPNPCKTPAAIGFTVES